MIKSMNGDNYLQVVSGSTPYITTNGTMCGMLRYNPTSYNVEVFDGSGWQTLSHHATVSLTPQATTVLEWGRRKMMEEQQLHDCAAKYPAVAAALQHRDKAQAVLDSVVALVKEY